MDREAIQNAKEENESTKICEQEETDNNGNNKDQKQQQQEKGGKTIRRNRLLISLLRDLLRMRVPSFCKTNVCVYEISKLNRAQDIRVTFAFFLLLRTFLYKLFCITSR